MILVKGKDEMFIPFSKAAVPVIDLAAGRIVVAPPAEIVVQPQAGDDGEDPA